MLKRQLGQNFEHICYRRGGEKTANELETSAMSSVKISYKMRG